MTRPMRSALRALVCAGAVVGTGPALAQFDYAVSGFGTVGYAKSNSSETYDRYIDRSGTARRDSLAGLQVDAKAFDDFGATVQVKAAPSTSRDDKYEASIPWAFVSWRPTNELLFRVGKQRIPYYLYSESFDVGASYDFARLPIEMYSIAPSNDFVGASVGRTFSVGDREFSINGYYGRSSNDFRQWARDAIPGVQDRGQHYAKLIFRGGGFVVSYHDADQVARFGVLHGTIAPAQGDFPQTFPFTSLAPGIGYYQASDAIPGPGVTTVRSVTNTLLTAGAELRLPLGVQLIGEFTRVISKGSIYAPQGNRGYAALLRKVDRWTPYVYYAFLKSPKNQIDLYTKENDNTVPAFIPGAPVINASQRIIADLNNAYDQSSVAVGTSFALSSTSKLKAEYLRTRVGAVSQLVDVGPGETPRNLRFQVLSLSYSVVFQ